MKTRSPRVAAAMNALASLGSDHGIVDVEARPAPPPAGLTASEEVRVAERLVDSVLFRLGPMIQPSLCQAEGLLRAALYSLEAARELMEGVPLGDLPAGPDDEEDEVLGAGI